MFQTCSRCQKSFKFRHQTKVCYDCRGFKSCRSCHQPFNSSNPAHTQCRRCYTKQNQKPCPICGRNHSGQFERCISCKNKIELKCKGCSKMYWGYLNEMCAPCLRKRDRIFDQTLKPEESRDGFRIRISYLVEERTHRGYCSDPGEEEETEYEEIVELPLIREFKNQNLDRSGIVVSGPLCYYERSSSHGCSKCQNSYQIKSAKVIKSERKIDLGE